MTDDKQEKFKKRLKDFFNQEFPVGGAVQDIAQESPASGAAKDIAFDKRKEDGDSSAKKQKIKDKQEQPNRENKKINFINEVLGTDLAVWGKLFDWDVDSNYQKIRKTMRAAWIRYTNTHKVSGNKDISTQLAQVQLKPQENTSAEKDNMTEEEQMDNLNSQGSNVFENNLLGDLGRKEEQKEALENGSEDYVTDMKNIMGNIFDEFERLMSQENKEKFYAAILFHDRFLKYLAGLQNHEVERRCPDKNPEIKAYYDELCEEKEERREKKKIEERSGKKRSSQKDDPTEKKRHHLDMLHEKFFAESYWWITKFLEKIEDIYKITNREETEKVFKKLMGEWLQVKNITDAREPFIEDLSKLLLKVIDNELPEDFDISSRESIKEFLIKGLKQIKLEKHLNQLPKAFYNRNDKNLLTDKDGKLLKGCGAYAQYLGIYAALKGLKGLKAPDNTLDDKDYKLAVMHFGSCKKCKESIDKIATMLEHQGYAKICNPFDKQKHSQSDCDFPKFENNEAEPVSEYAFSRYLLLLLSKGDIKKAKEVWNRKKDNYSGLRRSFSVLSEEKTNGSL